MWDMMPQPNFSSAVADLPDVLWLLIPVFIGIVGSSAALIVLEAIRYHRFRKTQSALETASTASSCQERA